MTTRLFRSIATGLFAILALMVVSTPSFALCYQQTLIVSPTVGDPVASGNALRTAVDSIAGNAWGTRFLVKVEPGVYDLGSIPLQMKEWVDIEGSGRDITLIKGSSTATLPDSGIILGVANAELRSLHVQATGTSTAVAVFTFEATSLRDVRLTASGSNSCWGLRSLGGDVKVEEVNAYINCSSYNSGISVKGDGKATLKRIDIRSFGASGVDQNIGVWFDGGALPYVFRDVEINAGNTSNPGTGVRIGNSIGGWLEIAQTSIHTSGGRGIYSDQPMSLKIRHSNIVASDIGIHLTNGNWLFVHQSLVAGTTSTIEMNGQVKVGGSQLDGGPVFQYTGTPKCAGVYDENFNFFPNTCP